MRVTQSVAAVNDAMRDDALVPVGAGGGPRLGVVVAWVIAGSLARPPSR